MKTPDGSVAVSAMAFLDSACDLKFVNVFLAIMFLLCMMSSEVGFNLSRSRREKHKYQAMQYV
jgi:hypothetical protein